MTDIVLHARTAGGGRVERAGSIYRLALPAGDARAYRWAQLDDYIGLPRRRFKWRAPLAFELRARVSAAGIPGTWGFGFWNDPFTASFTIRGASAHLPTLPNAAWFFHGSQENYLSLRNDLPASGFTAGTFASARIPSALLIPALPFAPLLLVKPFARLARRLGRGLVKQTAVAPDVDVTQWHLYRIEWQPERVSFSVDASAILQTRAAPRPPLGLVIWIDNQYAAFRPDGRIGFGVLPSDQDSWLEVEITALS